MTRASKLGKNGKPVISERAFQQQILKVAKLTGWLAYHTYDSRRSAAGFPDLVLVHPKRGLLIFAELKSEAGKVSMDQQRWFDALRQVTFYASPRVRLMLLRPSDFDWFFGVLKK